MQILVTGGAGYIGSHTCVALLNEGHEVIVVDNLCNSDIRNIKSIEQITKRQITFYNIDVTNEDLMEEIFVKHKIDGVIHFAGYKAVGESVRKPLKYYYNNVVSTLVILKKCQIHNISKFVFSSSATVYGENRVPFVETMDLLKTQNPYGETKVISERILRDVAEVNPEFSISILRYFNPIGAHISGLLGEKPSGTPNNLMPYITQVCKGKIEKLQIFGGDYPTLDGTGIRDYVHVMDLAEGHVAALNKTSQGLNIFNLGTGKGTSVLELVSTFEKVNKIIIPYEIVSRRPGDIASCYADVSKAEKDLGWKAKRNLISMCEDSWRFEKNYTE